MRPINDLIIHHSACLEGSVPIFTREHRQRGFGTIGYHGVIGNGHGQPDGAFAQGRPDSVAGCGVFGANTGKLHICLVGNFHRPDAGYTGRPTTNQLNTLGAWLLNRGTQYHITSDHIKGHKEVTVKGHPTACPGSDFPLDAVRKWYSFAQVCRKTGHTPPFLAAYLYDQGYHTDDLPSATPPAVIINRNGEAKQYTGPVKIIDGKTFVSVSDFTLAMNWPLPTWNPGKREVEIHTNTP